MRDRLMRTLSRLMFAAGILALLILATYVLTANTDAAQMETAATTAPTPIRSQSFSATVAVIPSATALKLSETLVVTVSVIPSEGCTFPIYELTLGQDASIFEYVSPSTATVGPPVSNPFTYTLTAVSTGTVTFDALVYGERYCGDYWQWMYLSGESEPVRVWLEERRIYLPLILKDRAEISPGLLVYPYLGETSTTSAVISWATDNAGASEVHYGEGSVVTATSTIYDDKYWHSATITGLTPDTTYNYKIYTAGHDLTPWPEVTFTTAPEFPQFTFAVLGDGRPDDRSSPPSQAALDVAAQMNQHSFDLALHTGDIVHSGGVCSGEDSSWNQYIRAYFDLYRESISGTPFYPSIGNHELSGGGCGYQGYTDVFAEEAYYSFDWGNAHFVALDTNQSYRPGSPQYEWLVSDLQTNSPWKFVFFHHPAYSSGSHGSTREVQTHLVPVFEAYGVDVVFNGHDHLYERTCPILSGACGEGVVYYVTGGAGAPLYSGSGEWFTAVSSSTHHFLKVEVDDCRLRVDAVDGVVFDSYEIDHCGSP
jgi:hypothetical protein